MALNFATLPRRRGKMKQQQPADLIDSNVDDEAAASQLFQFLLDAGLDNRFVEINRQLGRLISPSELADWSSQKLRQALSGLFTGESGTAFVKRFRQLLTLERRRNRMTSSWLIASVLRRFLTTSGVEASTDLIASTRPSRSRKCRADVDGEPTRIAWRSLRLGCQMCQSMQLAAWLPASNVGESPDESPAAAVPVVLLRSRTAGIGLARMAKLISLKHRSVAKLFGATEATDVTGVQLLVMELAPFGSLLDCLRERRLRRQLHPGVLCSLAQQLAEGMSYLENRNQPHGSLCASNILVFGLDRVKLSHPVWTSARAATQLAAEEAADKFDGWRAPEQTAESTPTIPADVWSFGVTLWEIFSHGERPNPHRVAKSCPRACPSRIYAEMILDRCCQWDVNRRANFSQLALHLPKILPERRLVIREQRKLSPSDLALETGDVIVVLNDHEDGQPGCGWLGARIPNYTSAVDEEQAADADTIDIGRFDPSFTAAASTGKGCAAAPAAAPATAAAVTRRATLGISYAREFGQRISRFKRAAQSRLLHSPSQLTQESSEWPPPTPIGAAAGSDAASLWDEIVQTRRPRRRRVTSDMISEPRRAEFRHAGHVGADGTVFGDVSCLAELQLEPTCEPPDGETATKTDDKSDDQEDAGSVVYRRRRPPHRRVDSLREQSGYCRLGSSLSVGVDSLVADSSSSFDEDNNNNNNNDDNDEEEELPTSTVGLSTDFIDVGGGGSVGNNGLSLIDEILQAWGSAASAAAASVSVEGNVGDFNAVDERLDPSNSLSQTGPPHEGKSSNNSASCSSSSSSDCSHCSANSACCTDARCAENNPTPTFLKARQRHQCTSALFCSSPISISPVCSSSVSSLDSPVPHRAEAADHHECCSQQGAHLSPRLLQPPPPIVEPPNLTAGIERSGSVEYEEDIVNM